MSETAGTAGRPRRSRLGLVLGVAALVVAGWSAAWHYVRGEVERGVDASLAQMGEGGIAVTCPGRALGGYPFRIELACPSGLSIEDRVTGLKTRFAAARAVALIYSPSHIIVELDAPAEAAARTGERIEAGWRVLQASLRLRDGQLQRVSLAADGLTGRATAPGRPEATFEAARLELHGRPDVGIGGLDLAARVDAGGLTSGGRRLGPEKLDLALDAGLVRLPLGAEPGPRFLEEWAGNDGRLELRSVRVAAGKTALDGKGALSLEIDGTVSGSVGLVATGLDALAGGSAAPVAPEVAMLASGFMIFGKPAKDGPAGGRSLEFVVDHGRMRLGGTPLGRLPPLFLPAQGS